MEDRDVDRYIIEIFITIKKIIRIIYGIFSRRIFIRFFILGGVFLGGSFISGRKSLSKYIYLIMIEILLVIID